MLSHTRRFSILPQSLHNDAERMGKPKHCCGAPSSPTQNADVVLIGRVVVVSMHVATSPHGLVMRPPHRDVPPTCRYSVVVPLCAPHHTPCCALRTHRVATQTAWTSSSLPHPKCIVLLIGHDVAMSMHIATS
jgi:hypothetical protein